MHKYIYEGAVLKFGACVGNLRLETMAESQAKATNNILFQVKKMLNLEPYAGGITLLNKVRKID